MNKISSYIFISLVSAIIFFAPNSALAQQKQITKGTVVRVKVHGKLLEGNLDGDSADRNVSIYLPASYQKNTTRRYPVVYSCMVIQMMMQNFTALVNIG